MTNKPFVAVLTQKQRDAAAHARADKRWSCPEISRLAAAGELEYQGETLGPFVIDSGYVRKLGADLVRDRAGKNPSALAKLPPRDATEALRVRLINLADAELRHLERQAAGKRDLARLRDVIRCVKEAASIAPPKETQRRPGTRDETGEITTGATTRSGHTGALLAAMRGARSNETQSSEDHTSEASTSTGSHARSSDAPLAA